MRTSGDLSHATAATTTQNATFSPPATIQRSPWQSPVPYLFGGFAAMMAIVAFALLILACSYWKLSGQVNSGYYGGDGDVESSGAGEGDGGSDTKPSVIHEKKLLVIMAGEVKPTFLATPTSSRDSSFSAEKTNSKEKGENEKQKKHHNDSDQESQLSHE